MGGGGHMMAAIKSMQANRSMRKGRNHLFDKNVKAKGPSGEKKITLPKPSAQTREKFKDRQASEKRRDRRVWTISIILSLLLCVWWYSLITA